MTLQGSPEDPMARQRARLPMGPTASAGVHGLLVGVLLLATRHHHRPEYPLRLPGTLEGQHMLLTYTTGSPAKSQQSSVLHSQATHLAKPKVAPSPVQQAARSFAPLSETGAGAAGDSALGDGDVRVALPQIHPRPMPDLSVLPHGVAGDVVVDVSIDETGRVTATTLVKGLGGTIDATVVQVLRDWTFTPATKNGQNIASEQEIIVHYERG